MWQINYYYDGILIGDLFPICDNGFTGSIARNSATPIAFNISARKLQEWCTSLGFDITRMFTPIKSSVIVKQIFDTTYSGESMGGWLAATPTFSFANSADTTVSFSFVSWLGLLAGYYLIPPYSYNTNFNLAAKAQIDLAVERTFLAGSQWPISYGTSDTLAVVSDTLEAPKTLKDFLLERTDNTTGTGSFDVYINPRGVIQLKTSYGLDLSSTTTFSYPDNGGKYGIKEISFDAWDDYISDVFLTGAGNGYASTSGAEGAAIFSTATNSATRANTGYWQTATSESDIISQTVLDNKATSYVKNTDKPFSTPSLRLDGDPFKWWTHDDSGDIWLGDTIKVDTTGWVEDLLPFTTPISLRINSIDMTVDKIGHCEINLGMANG